MKILKKFTSITAAAMLLTASNVSILPILSENDFVVSAGTASDAPISGKCGEVTWNLDSEGTLTISGEGAMIDRDTGYGGPWDSYTEKIVNVIIENGVTNIGGYAFRDCVNLTSITIPDSVTNIGGYAFRGCVNLTSITIPDSVTDIGDLAFHSCSSLTSITIPEGVTSIGRAAFARCKNLTSITIPDSVSIIKSEAFDDTPWFEAKLKENPLVVVNGKLIDGKTCKGDVVIPDGVTYIADSAFYSCNELTSITFPDSVTCIDDYAFRYCEGLTSITIPDSVISIGKLAFSGCSNLTSVTIPNSITRIKKMSFDDTPWFEAEQNENPLVIVNGILIDGNKCEGDIVIPDGVTCIADNAFSLGNRITSITIPDSVTSIGESAFNKSILIIVSPQNKLYTYEEDVLFNKDKSVLIKYPAKKTAEEYTVPDSVIYIEDYAFELSEKLTSVIIPDSVTSIGDSAFLGSGITSLIIPDSVTSIGDSAFRFTSLTSVTIPESVKSIGKDTFECCQLTSITIPDSVTSIGDSAFSDCSKLSSVTIPDSVTSIGNSAFSDCSKLSSVTIPDSVTSIGASAFSGCSKLSSVTIPKNVTYIGTSAFNKISSIRINNPECVIGDSSDTIFENATIYGYEGSTAQAYAEKYERKFVSIDAGQSSTTTVPPAVVDGDSNGDGVVNLADAILILQSIGNPDKYRISESHLEAADVFQRGSGITSMDALCIQKYLLRLIDTLPAE